MLLPRTTAHWLVSQFTLSCVHRTTHLRTPQTTGWWSCHHSQREVSPSVTLSWHFFENTDSICVDLLYVLSRFLSSCEINVYYFIRSPVAPDAPAQLQVRKQLSSDPVDPADCKEFSESKYVLKYHYEITILSHHRVCFDSKNQHAAHVVKNAGQRHQTFLHQCLSRICAWNHATSAFSVALVLGHMAKYVGASFAIWRMWPCRFFFVCSVAQTWQSCPNLRPILKLMQTLCLCIWNKIK